MNTYRTPRTKKLISSARRMKNKSLKYYQLAKKSKDAEERKNYIKLARFYLGCALRTLDFAEELYNRKEDNNIDE